MLGDKFVGRVHRLTDGVFGKADFRRRLGIAQLAFNGRFTDTSSISASRLSAARRRAPAMTK